MPCYGMKGPKWISPPQRKKESRISGYTNPFLLLGEVLTH
jgi:hypothetical protein